MKGVKFEYTRGEVLERRKFPPHLKKLPEAKRFILELDNIKEKLKADGLPIEMFLPDEEIVLYLEELLYTRKMNNIKVMEPQVTTDEYMELPVFRMMGQKAQ